MKINKTVFQKIKASEGKRYLELTIGADGIEEFDSNLPYIKSIEDFRFYGKAILRILKPDHSASWRK